MVSWLRGTKLRFKLEYSCHRPPLESVFLNLVISETIQWKLSRPRLFRDSNFLFLRDRDFSRLQIFKSLETETFPRLQFRVFRDRDFPRLGKSCRDRDFFETLADLCAFREWLLFFFNSNCPLKCFDFLHFVIMWLGKRIVQNQSTQCRMTAI